MMLKLHLRVTDDSEDDAINRLIVVARIEAETFTNRQLMPATWDLYLDRFPSGLEPIELPKCPVTAVSSITYTDGSGDTQTWSSANYIQDLFSEPARVTLAYNAVWPEVRHVSKSIRVRYTAGYANAAAVPAPIKQAMLLLLSSLYKEREDGEALKQRSRDLLSQYQLGDEFTCYGQASYGI